MFWIRVCKSLNLSWALVGPFFTITPYFDFWLDNCYFNSLTRIYVARQVDICPLFQPYLLYTSKFYYNWKIVHNWDLWNQTLCFSWKWTCIMKLKHSNLPEIVWNEWVLESLVVVDIPQLREETHFSITKNIQQKKIVLTLVHHAHT